MDKKKTQKFIRKLLNYSGFPDSKKFVVRKKNGRLVVRFRNNIYG